ncbi:MAG: TPM domain-containing protein [Marinilabiliaceae bacterium]|nr:TPM domain-containing protein [Marinilabiliaceae bacterium]
MKNWKRTLLLMLLVFVGGVSSLYADIPEKPQPQRLVNDYVGIIDATTCERLESRLVAFDDTTSTQIAVVVVPDLEGYNIAEYATTIGQKWGVGQEGYDNGVVILIKPKRDETDYGEAFISTGYGLEGDLPDIICARIVNEEMAPFFAKEDYSGGIEAGVSAVMKAVQVEHKSAAELEAELDEELAFVRYLFYAIIFCIAVLLLWTNWPRSRKKVTASSLIGDFFIALANSLLTILSGSGGGSNYGSFSKGSGSFRGGSFGGFGGGSFGGGGGGGRW